MMGFRRPGRDLESQLRRERPTPPDALVQQISRSTGQRVVRRGRRVGFALAMTLPLV